MPSIPCGRPGAGEFAERRQDVGEVKALVADRAGFDPAGPVGDERHTDAALVEAPLEPAQLPRRVEEGRIRAADVVGGAVVAGEDHERVLLQAKHLELGHDAADRCGPCA